MVPFVYFVFLALALGPSPGTYVRGYRQGTHHLCFPIGILWFQGLRQRLQFQFIFVYGIQEWSSSILLQQFYLF